MREYQKRADARVDDRNPDELVERIRKLRWLGMEEEAQVIVAELSMLNTRVTVVPSRLDTD